MAPYLQLFLDSLLVSSFIPTDGETTLRYMLYYGLYPKPLLLLVCMAGALVSLSISWLLGKFAYEGISRMNGFKPYEGRYAKCNAFANKYALALVVIGFFNQAEAVLSFIAGMLKVRLPIFLAAVAIGKFVYFAIFIFAS